MTIPKVVLASGSEARLRVLRQAGIEPEVSVSGVDESAEGLTTEVAVSVLAERKASAVAPRFPGSLVLGCDSLLDLDGITFAKPRSETEAALMWSQLSGRTATLYTGHCLIDRAYADAEADADTDTDTGKRTSAVASTMVNFGTPTEMEIAAYVSSGEPMALAGAFSIDGLGAPFVEGIEGDPSNVLGLSLPLLRRMLADLGVRIFDLWRKPISPKLRRVTEADRGLICDLVAGEWGLPVVSVSGVYDPSMLPGIVAEQDGELLGALTYRICESDMEVVTLNSLLEDRGVGTSLLAEARRMAKSSGRRLWLITTNENLRAIAFYQRRGMEIAALHRNFADEVRALKGDPGESDPEGPDPAGPDPEGPDPAGPDLGAGDPHESSARIVFRHAIEFEYPL